MSKLVENYLLQESVGKGAYGQVYRAENQKNKGVYAVKVIPKSSFKSNPKLEQLAINQINILSSIKHQNIVAFIQTLKTSNNFYFVYEYCNEGTLENLLRTKKYLKQSEALIFFKQLLQAFKQLNKNNIMHRDLKPDNIFLSDGMIKLGDFGFCKMLEVNMAQTMLGSPIYMAPQILKQQIYTSKADIWSLGVVLFQMLFGFCPFQSNSISELMNKLKQSEVVIPHEINPICEQTEILLRKMLIKDQFKRIQWADLFGFVISDQGKIISGCKSQFAIENLQRYFLNDSDSFGSTPNIINAISSQDSTNTYNTETKQPIFKTTQSAQRNTNTIDEIKENTKSEEQYPYTSGFTLQPNEEPKNKAPQNYDISNGSPLYIMQSTTLMKKNSKNNINDTETFSNNGKLIFKRKPQLIIGEPFSKKKIEKQKFGDVHNRWLDAVKLVEDLALNNSNGNYIEICIYILFHKLLQRLEKGSQNYPEWTDVLIQQQMTIKQSLQQLQKTSKSITKLIENEKDPHLDKYKKQLLKIWEKTKNKFTLQRAIRATFDKQSKDITIQDILK